MRCKECAYCYKTDRDDYPTCQYEGPDEWCPCVAQDEADRIERERQEEEEFKRQIMAEYAE